MISRPAARALPLAETAVATAIVGLMLVAALNTVGAAVATGVAVRDRQEAALLCEALLAEIAAQPYAVPGSPQPGSTRDTFDEVGDYAGWSAAPPQTAAGVVLGDYRNWRRSVELTWIHPWSLDGDFGFDTGARRVRVTVSRDGEELATATLFHSASWQAARDE